MLTKIVLVLFLFGNYTTTHAYDRSWHAGDIFTFTYSSIQILTDTDLEYNVQDVFETVDQETGTLNVTEINLLSGRYHSIWTGRFGVGPNVGNDFTVEDYINTYLDTNSFFSIDYEWDYGTNSTIFVDFDVNIGDWLLIEPNWVKLNTAFIDLFNESEIIETVADPYLPITHNITLGDFLNSITYTIMGKNKLADAKSKIKADNTAWSFIFDLSNAVNMGVFNGTLGYDEYYPYQEAILTYEMSYSKGGVLERFLYEGRISSVVDNQRGDIFQENIIIFGDLEAMTGNFAYWMIVPGFLLIVAVVRIANRKSNRRNR